MPLDLKRVQEVFLAAVDIADPAARQTILDRECASDPELRRRVNDLLDSHDRPNAFLDTPVVSPDFMELALPVEGSRDRGQNVETLPSASAGSIIGGRYRLLELIGEGGMGTVWKAEQLQPVRRSVALKLIRPGMATKTVLARFEAERQALALMAHPNIATVLDGGTTQDGCPFFVMELVQGTPLTDYCDARRMSIPGRLRLFLQVCHAVQHAHQRGIIHRDIKPTNILIAERDGQPVSKVIDFGLAKALQDEEPLTDTTPCTVYPSLVGSPLYMAPEQFEGNSHDVDTRADVYSLGVILYELLTGSTPIERQRFKEARGEGVGRLIREFEPPRASNRIAASPDVGEIATRRHTEPEKLIRAVRGDLDWIVLRALEKDRTRRYPTAVSLATEVEHYLANEPVAARPPTGLYRFQKLARRHRIAFTASAAVIVAVMIGLAFSAWMFVKQRAALAQAETEATRSQQVADFMKEMLQGVGPKVALRRDTRLLREILDQTAERLSNLRSQPAVEADLLTTLGNVYYDLGEFARAKDMHTSALGIRKTLYGDEHPDVAVSLNAIGQAYYGLGRFTESEAIHRQALAMRRKLLGNEHLDVAESLANLGESMRRDKPPTHVVDRLRADLPIEKYREMEAMQREALAIRRKLLGNEHPDIATSLTNLGLVLWYEAILGETGFTEAEAMHRQALAMRRKLLGNEHPDVATSLDRLGLVLHWDRRYAESVSVNREALAIRRAILGEYHPDLAQSLFHLANSLQFEAEWVEAEALLREALKIRRKLVPNGSPDLASTLNMLAWNLSVRSDTSPRDAQEAVDFAKEALELTPDSGRYWNTLGVAHYRIGDFAGAVSELQKAVDLNKGGNSYDWFFLAMANAKLGNREEAHDWYDKAVEWADENRPNDLRLKAIRTEATSLVGEPSDTPRMPAN